MTLRALCLWLLVTTSPLAAYAAPPAAPDPAAVPQPGTDIIITGTRDDTTEGSGSYTVKTTRGATKLPLTLKETPQSVTVITRDQMTDFGLRTVNDVLASTTGINVQEVETNRTYYSARGFDITNFQYDGFGLPLVDGIQNGTIDTAVYDRVEVLRGANGLMSSTGNPSATVNFVRKRPADGLAVSSSFTGGSYDTKRGDADISTPLNATGSVRLRLVGAYADGDSQVDRYNNQRGVGYAVVEADLDPRTTVSAGYQYQDDLTRGGLWGALPLYYTDGTPTDYGRGTSTAAKWSRWDIQTHQIFADIRHDLGSGWTAKASVLHRLNESDGDLFYVYGTPDKATGDGLYSYPSAYHNHDRQWTAEAYVSGPVEALGRSHDLVIGGNWGRNNTFQHSDYGQGIGTPLPGLSAFDGNYAEPSFDAYTGEAHYYYTRETGYAAARLSLLAPLKLIAGVNVTHVKMSGDSYGAANSYDVSRALPYAGLVYEVTPEISAYTSYAQIFNPQTQLDVNNHVLTPIDGDNVEVGAKGAWFDEKLNASVALFQARQNNTAESAGYNLATGQTYYTGVNATAQGIEAEVSGRLLPQVQVSAGYTLMKIEDDAGRAARTYVPRQTLRLATNYQATDKLKLGATLSWQSRIYRDQGAVSTTTGREIYTTQDAYALLGVMARYEVDRHWSITANLNNLTDEKYITSLYWAQGYYGPGLNGTVTIGWKM
ncbi:TonB-dependent siderophore receptor [Nitrospirillum sp. BR 11752]|uniref:TonB-dependent siderophore receptor n=1 Tax=Nitrospirillum sp. BR 11752 TaxID=3104293 RepID=UPI002EB4163E|nr:TonB-dependent siderophore receptor [Nitrospirillum sp. BR 11752]